MSDSVVLEMTVDKAFLKQGQVRLNTVLTNTGADPITFLPWNSPFDKSVNGRFLRVKRVDDGGASAVPYLGRMVKRSAPVAEDYVSIDTGASISNTLDITEYYKFCADGKYIIAFAGPLYNADQAEVPFTTNKPAFSTGRAFPECG